MKRIFLNIEIAWHSLSNFKLRTFLALCGVTLGTFSLVLVANLTGSIERKSKIEVDKLGKNLLIVRCGVVLKFGERTRTLSEATTLTKEDAQAILAGSAFVEDVAPATLKQLPVRYKETTLKSVFIMGGTPNIYIMRNYKLAKGVFYNDKDNRAFADVAVIGYKVADKLFKNQDPIGKYIKLSDIYCQVIGVLEELGSDISGADQDNQVIIPISTYMRKIENKDFINIIYVRGVSDEVFDKAKNDIEEILRRRHKIHPGDQDDFTVIDMKDVMAIRAQVTKIITVLGRLSASISFLIGGLGILSIMILIVSERKMEIGIRRAVGSRKKDIIFQFLTESSLISLTGGVFGIIVGFVFCSLIFHFSKLPYYISLFSLISSMASSFAVGVIAGIYPARKAIQIQPIDVMRSR